MQRRFGDQRREQVVDPAGCGLASAPRPTGRRARLAPRWPAASPGTRSAARRGGRRSCGSPAVGAPSPRGVAARRRLAFWLSDVRLAEIDRITPGLAVVLAHPAANSEWLGTLSINQTETSIAEPGQARRVAFACIGFRSRPQGPGMPIVGRGVSIDAALLRVRPTRCAQEIGRAQSNTRRHDRITERLRPNK